MSLSNTGMDRPLFSCCEQGFAKTESRKGGKERPSPSKSRCTFQSGSFFVSSQLPTFPFENKNEDFAHVGDLALLVDRLDRR